MRHPRRFRFASRTAQGVLLGILCGLFALLLGALGWTRSVEMGASAQMFRLRGPLMPDPAVILLVVDDETIARAGQWPLPRRDYAEVVSRLRRVGARVIAFDLLLTTASQDADDQALALACERAGNVVQSAAFHVQAAPNSVLPVSIEAGATPAHRFQITQKGAPLLSATWATVALPSLLASAPALGHVNVFPENNGSLRRIPHIIAYRDGVYPSLALAVAAAAEGKKPSEIIATPTGVKLGNHDIPLDQNGEAWINWVGANRSFPTYSFNEFLDGRVPARTFKDRIVIIGATAAGTFEHRPTPFSAVQPSIEFQASALDNILQDRVLRPFPWWAQAAAVLVLAAFTGGLMAPQRAPGNTLLLFLLIIVSMLAALAALQNNLYIPLATPLLAGALTYAATVTLNYRQEWEANWRTESAMGALARGGALMASGRERSQLRAMLCEVAREALDAEKVFFVSQRALDGNNSVGGSTPSAALGEVLFRVAAHARQTQRLLLWPPPKEKLSPDAANILVKSEPKRDEMLEWLWQKSAQSPTDIPSDLIVAISIETKSTTPTVLAAPLPGRGDVLIAAGRAHNDEFTARDALLLETLAEQAALAFENLEYYEKLQGRVEAADRDLQETYNLLVEQSAKLIAAVENIDSAMIVTDASGAAIFVNSVSAAILREAAPALGENVADILRARGLDEIAAMLGEPGDAERRDVVLHEGEDARRVLSVQRTLLDEGATSGEMLIVSDVTAERELEQMKTEFVAFVAHELRSPLSTIYGYASLLQTSADRISAADRAGMTASISNQCRRLNRMISEMLDVSRMEAGHPISISRQPMDLAALCEKVLADARAALPPTTKHNLRLQSETAPLRLSADADRLEQVLTNLVSNAVKYSPDGGDVTVSLAQDDEAVFIRVHDEGMGLTQEQIAQLFQKYYRTKSAQDSNIKGTGLGLFLVKQLVAAHDGQISVESTPGAGTTFCVTLPKRLQNALNF